jgi:hypothetical protein
MKPFETMTVERWDSLMKDGSELELSKEEIKNGWHFCPCWDGLLIGEKMGELDFCYCNETV